MRAMILAAGRGERMRPLTDHTPKPLLQVGGKPLIVWHIERLARAGISDLVINTSWLGDQIQQTLGDGSRYGARISYSPESTALETAGGIAQALPFFQDQPFLVINGDVWCDWDPAQAELVAAGLSEDAQAWLLLVDNPPQHPDGDFRLHASGLVADKNAGAGAATFTFAGIGIYRPDLFKDIGEQQAAPLAPLLRQAMAAQHVFGMHHPGQWIDVGTPDRLGQLDKALRC
ncbi:N-acetylmuramate alpha-1-phosphate uridylyltransferase MurU [Pollutimonas bauzanensis]|uniref:N-acetylmuramate alpha-1-phosphate uridylyltransferase MurU n=1 Tax=Pollutimonas bauzanensis TaxID=658167 RepID=UPI0033429C38